MESKYDRIGKGYNTTRKADPFLTQSMLRLLSPEKGKKYLDIGCGTGNYTAQFAASGYTFTGMDPSENMLSAARSNYPDVNWIKGTAEHTLIQENSFHGITGMLTLHHWENLPLAFKELERILMPGGKMVFFTSTPEQMKGYWLSHFFPQMLKDSMDQMPSMSTILSALTSTALSLENTEQYAIRNEQIDLFLYAGKNRPELYLNEQVRKGISSFADLAYESEVQQGLSALQKAIEDGSIHSIIQSFENQTGDYLFFTLKKPK